VLKALVERKSAIVLVVNKVDRIKDKQRILPYLSELSVRHPFIEVFPVSARNGDNIDRLENTVVSLLPEGENLFPEDQLTDRSERFFAAELIREELTRRYAKEIPYALTVEIERFEEEGNLYRIGAVIWVERKGQKNIIIGSKGEALKEVATQARLEMERFYGKKVFLDVWIKIKKSWSNDESALAKLGYGD